VLGDDEATIVPVLELRLKLAAELVLDLIGFWGVASHSLHVAGVFVRLTAKVFEIATDKKIGSSTAKRACAEALDSYQLPRERALVFPTDVKKFMAGQQMAKWTAEREATHRAEMINWVPLDKLLEGR
jgi:hypothetical protein